MRNDLHRDGTTVDVGVTVDPSHDVAALGDALARCLGTRPGGAGFEVVRVATGEILDPRAALDAVGLVSGEEVALRPTVARLNPASAGIRKDAPGHGAPWLAAPAAGLEPSGQPRLDLVVTSGPDVGQRRHLTAGRLLVGRDPSCQLTLSDPRAARVHLVVTVDPADATVEVEPGPSAPDDIWVEGVRLGAAGPPAATEVAVGDRIVLGATALRVEPAPAPDPGPRAGVLGEAPFHRTPYFPAPVEPRVFEPLGDLPETPEPVRFAYLAALAPLAFGITMALLYSPRFLVFAAFSPLLALAGYLEQRKRTSQRQGKGAARYRRRLEGRLAAIDEAQRAERAQRFASAPDLSDLAERARLQAPNLWVRDRRSDDVLTLRLGLGSVPSAVEVRPETRGDEALRDELTAELAARALLHQVPVTIDLARTPVAGLVGSRADTGALAGSLLLQAACLHSPEDLVIVAATADDDLHHWLRWLPHTRSSSSPLDGAHLARHRPDAEHLVRALLVTAEQRLADTDRSIDRRWPRLLALIDHDTSPEPAVVSRLLDIGPAVGLSVLWRCSSPEGLPRQALATATVAPAVAGRPSRLVHTDPSLPDQTFHSERVAAGFADRAARHLAGLRDASVANASSALPRTVTLHQTLGVDTVTPGWVATRWRLPRGHSLPAPVGMTASGPLVLDLVEHGPHGLIGGTSGAGKSELLMALVAGLVAHNPPNRLNLLFIDYKGGASSEPFRPLPHTVGCVTNLDALLARRALISLRAELNRRMALLQGRAKDLTEMLDRHPGEAPPALVIVVDEFATLVKEVPDFVPGVVDIAQRGRSLGIHLLLATQRPSGAVNDNILANTNLRISLRMLDGAESSSVIGTPDAATIPTPLKGRGLARLGPGALVQFQAAWTGAPRHRTEGPPPVLVNRLTTAADQQPRPHHRRPGSLAPGPTAPEGTALGAGPGATGSGETQLAGLVAAVIEAAADRGLSRGPAPWLDELPDHLSLTEVAARAAADPAPGAGVPVGLIDDPGAQAQYPARIDLAAGAVLVVGTGGSGKTTALRALAVAAGGWHGERQEPFTVVGLDFASRELAGLTSLACCAGVATGDDLDAVTRTIALLDRLLQQRRSALARAALDGAAPPRFAPVLVLIDEYGNLAQTFEGTGAASALHPWLETLNRVVVDGRQVAIHTALTASRRAVVKPAILSAVGTRIALRQADPAGYADLGLPSAVAEAELGPGRGLVSNGNLVQLATVDQTDVRRVSDRGAVARRERLLVIPALPTEVALTVPGSPAAPWLVPLGPADLDHETVVHDASARNLTVFGDPGTGRSTALDAIATQLMAGGIEVWVAGPASSPLRHLTGPARHLFGRPADVACGLAELAEALEADPDLVRRVALVIDDVDLLEDPHLDTPAARLLAVGVRYTAATSTLRGYTVNGLVQDMKKARAVLCLQPPGPREVHELTGVAPRLRPGLAMVPGRGVLVVDRAARAVQVARRRAEPC